MKIFKKVCLGFWFLCVVIHLHWFKSRWLEPLVEEGGLEPLVEEGWLEPVVEEGWLEPLVNKG